jgi:hypothetical protein
MFHIMVDFSNKKTKQSQTKKSKKARVKSKS